MAHTHGPAEAWPSDAHRSVRGTHRGASRSRTMTSRPPRTAPAPRSVPWSAPGTGAAGSPGARSPPGSATSTTCGPGRPGAPRAREPPLPVPAPPPGEARPGWWTVRPGTATASPPGPTRRDACARPARSNALDSLVLGARPRRRASRRHRARRPHRHRVAPSPQPASSNAGGQRSADRRRAAPAGVRSSTPRHPAGASLETTVRGSTSGPLRPPRYTGAARPAAALARSRARASALTCTRRAPMPAAHGPPPCLHRQLASVTDLCRRRRPP